MIPIQFLSMLFQLAKAEIQHIPTLRVYPLQCILDFLVVTASILRNLPTLSISSTFVCMESGIFQHLNNGLLTARKNFLLPKLNVSK